MNEVTARAATYEDIVAASNPKTFPCWVLEGAEHPLFLYGAGFFGRQDAVFAARAGVQVASVVDANSELMDAMRRMYSPTFPGWTWRTCSVGEYPLRVGQHDVIVLDPWTNDIRPSFAFTSDHALRCAARYVVTGYYPAEAGVEVTTEMVEADIPGSRCVEVLKRSGHRGGVWWAVLERAS